ncbi:MAG: YfcE family phosphodiesterase [Deltaproteobacteria bacterium]|nr:YfcE family phosphodiesterase [Deltaproteobacteria bacterium]
MKIGVIADSHLTKCEEQIFAVFRAIFADCEMIIHAGDFVDISIVNCFSDKKFVGVAGNMDGENVRKQFPVIEQLVIADKRIIVVHDLATLPKAEMEHADCIIFGHTHNPVNLVSGSVLLFNPGSSSSNRYGKRKTVGILEIDAKVVGKIIEIEP